MRYLAAVDTVHTAAAQCDYFGKRIGPGDEVVAVTVSEPTTESTVGETPADERATDDRDRQEALNVIGVRLAVSDVETVERQGEVATELLDVASEFDVDGIVLGRRAGTPDASSGGVGSTAEAVLAHAERPVVVLPSVGV